MPRFVDTRKRDPFRGFQFQLALGGVVVAACRKMSGLTGSVDVVKFRAGNSLHTNDELSPGRVRYEPVMLESGLTNDKSFEDWALMLIRNEFSGGPRALEPNFRRDVEVTVMDLDATTPVLKYVLHNSWPSKCVFMSELNAEGNETLISSLELQLEGFTRINL